MTTRNDSRLRTAAAFVFGWLCTISIFVAAAAGNWLLAGRAPPVAIVAIYAGAIAAYATVYVMSTAWWAYAAVGWFARRSGSRGKSWSAYCKAGLLGGAPYFGICLLLCIPGSCPGTTYWLAGLLSSLAYASIGYWLVERGWPWQRRRRGSRPSEEPAGPSGAGGAA